MEPLTKPDPEEYPPPIRTKDSVETIFVAWVTEYNKAPFLYNFIMPDSLVTSVLYHVFIELVHPKILSNIQLLLD